jgi:uncharacterized SAM-binding protein YcdF (DUF218 family)
MDLLFQKHMTWRNISSLCLCVLCVCVCVSAATLFSLERPDRSINCQLFKEDSAEFSYLSVKEMLVGVREEWYPVPWNYGKLSLHLIN